jgi:PAS domain S-box-containing protein
MTKYAATPTGREVFFDSDEIIVSKSDLKGRITYANEVFCGVAGYTEEELLGQPHSIIRHPDMPRAAFKYLWDRIQSGDEIFVYVKNMAKTGDHYWVLAHVTPTFDAAGNIIGYHSNRRVPDRKAVEAMEKIYAEVKAAEDAEVNGKDALAAGMRCLEGAIAASRMSFDELVFSL